MCVRTCMLVVIVFFVCFHIYIHAWDILFFSCSCWGFTSLMLTYIFLLLILRWCVTGNSCFDQMEAKTVTPGLFWQLWNLSAGFRDWVPKELQRVGCVELLNTVQKRVRPKLHAFGGIHEGTGNKTQTVNCPWLWGPQRRIRSDCMMGRWPLASASVEKGSFTHVHMLTINKLCSVDFKMCQDNGRWI